MTATVTNGTSTTTTSTNNVSSNDGKSNVDVVITDDYLPIIDLSINDEDQIVKELMDAFTTIGFATLTNHGIESNKIELALKASKQFFTLSDDIKLQYKYQSHESNRGYIPFAAEIHDANSNVIPDPKETLDIGNETDIDYKNNWPKELSTTTFKDDLITYFTIMDQLYLRLMKYIGIGLQLDDPNFLVTNCNGQHENLRLLHYTKQSKSSSKELIRGNVHCDYGTITLLVQDNVGGLQVQRLDKTWINVKPMKDTIIINVGDMLMRWTNDVLKSTPHKVVAPPSKTSTTTTTDDDDDEEEIIPERYSIAFFCNANKEALLECLPTCCKEQPPKYEPINAHEYITKRLAATIGM